MMMTRALYRQRVAETCQYHMQYSYPIILYCKENNLCWDITSFGRMRVDEGVVAMNHFQYHRLLLHSRHHLLYFPTFQIHHHH
jgi:hypothetical protein